MRGILYLSFFLLTLSTHAQDRKFPYSDGAKWGLTNENLEVLIAPQYDTVFWFVGGKFAVVRKDHLYGVIGLDGKVIIPCEYEDLHGGQYGDAALAKKQGKFRLLSFQTGRQLSPVLFDKVDDYRRVDTTLFLLIKNNQQWYFLHLNTGRLVNKTGYEGAGFPYAFPSKGLVRAAKKCGVTDLRTGAIVLPIKYDNIDITYKDGNHVFAATTGGKTAYFTEEGKAIKPAAPKKTEDGEETVMAAPEGEVTAAVSEETWEYNQDVFLYKTGNDNWKVTYEKRPRNKAGSTEILKTYELKGYSYLEKAYYNSFSEQPAILKAKKDGKTGIINVNDKVLIPFIYDDVECEMDHIKTTRDHKKGLLNGALKEIKAPVLKDIFEKSYQFNAWHIETPDGKEGYMDSNTGKIFIPGVNL